MPWPSITGRRGSIRRPGGAPFFASAREIGYASDHKQGGGVMFLNRSRAAVIAASAAGLAVPALCYAAQAAAAAITCTNPASGASWLISIDYDKSTVDSNPARISDTKISWRSAQDLGNYTLDRKSGDLTVIVASSTGGYFLYDHCRLEN
jgi:hypothetical protein